MAEGNEEASPPPHVVTRLLQEWSKGDRAALNELLPLVYRELHKMAKRCMAEQSSDHTLQTTAVIHEAYLKLTGGAEREWGSRSHFYGVAAKAMRHVLVDHARQRSAEKRGGSFRMVSVDEGLAVADGPAREMLALDEALEVLAAGYPRQAELIELRYFAGLSVEEAAHALGVSPETAARDWRFAKSFLRREMERGAER